MSKNNRTKEGKNDANEMRKMMDQNGYFERDDASNTEHI